MNSSLSPKELGQKIYFIRGHRVMLDSDLAELYETDTRALNRAVRRNIARFPSEFMFELTKQECENLMYQIGTSSFSGHGGRRKLPLVFTEHGVVMLSSVVNSHHAVQVNIAIVKTFVSHLTKAFEPAQPRQMHSQSRSSLKSLVVLSGAGMSAESGLKTFRDADGLWEGHDVYTVAYPQGWAKNRKLVLDFYNQRRVQLGEVEPNAGHRAIAALESHYDVQVITQNVDDLHERAGSTQVLHLHGKLVEVRSSVDPTHIVNIGYRRLEEGELCPRGAQFRPNIVWFGEEVPLIGEAARITAKADILLVIGTSLQVYPAAGLIHEAPAHARRFLIDPKIPADGRRTGFTCIEKGAGEGMKEFIELVRPT